MRIGVDVGGTKIEAAALGDDGEIAIRRRIATPSGDYDAACDAIVELIRDIEGELDRQCPLGFGIPGTISPATGRVKNAYNSPFQGQFFDRDLEQRLGRKVRMMNDANCFALSESVDGNAVGAASVFGVILGTGCGGGLTIGGQVIAGANAIAGEWGHNPLPWPRDDERPGLECTCGKQGCIETFISGSGLSRQHEAATGETLAAHEIAECAAAGDAAAEASLGRYEDRLARALATVINLFDPEIVVFGGGMSNVERLYDNVPAMWSQWVFSDRVETRLTPPKYGDSSGVRGAAWLWPREGEA
ncbi:MAG: ROK family protein [Alphaproteobacteria bacterium]|nr:ROK family protein [Alphaproteobacteria bacterium]